MPRMRFVCLPSSLVTAGVAPLCAVPVRAVPRRAALRRRSAAMVHRAARKQPACPTWAGPNRPRRRPASACTHTRRVQPPKDVECACSDQIPPRRARLQKIASLSDVSREHFVSPAAITSGGAVLPAPDGLWLSALSSRSADAPRPGLRIPRPGWWPHAPYPAAGPRPYGCLRRPS